MWRPSLAPVAAPGDDLCAGAVETFQDNAVFRRKRSGSRTRGRSRKSGTFSWRHPQPGRYINSGVHFPILGRRGHSRQPVSMQNALCIVQAREARDSHACFVAVPEGGLTKTRGRRGRRGAGARGGGGGGRGGGGRGGGGGGGATAGESFTNDARISLFGALSGKLAYSLRGHLGEVTAVSFRDNRGGPEILTGSRDGQILAWKPGGNVMIGDNGDFGLGLGATRAKAAARRTRKGGGAERGGGIGGVVGQSFPRGLKPDVDDWSD